MKIIRRASLLALAIAASPLFASPATAQQPGYWSDGRGAVVKDPYNLCWRTSYWTAALASTDCDLELVPRMAQVAPPPAAPAPLPEVAPPAPPPEAAPPVAEPPPKPVPPPVAKPKRCDATVTMRSDEFFVFGKAVLADPAATRTRLEHEVRSRLAACATLEAIIVEGHTDRLGSPQVNQRLSEQRADAAKAALVSDLGIPADQIETLGMGKTLPVKSCPDAEYQTHAALVDCLAPNRRVVINIRGAGK